MTFKIFHEFWFLGEMMDEVFALATDTAWGLACDASDQKLTERIYSLKGRDFSKPLILFTHSLKEAKKLIHIPDELNDWLNLHWPGDLTLVAQAISNDYKHCHKQSSFLGVRIPNLCSTLNFLREFSTPLAVTSFNLSTQSNISSRAQLKTVFANFNPAIVGDMPKVTAESAVLKVNGQLLEVLRAHEKQIHNLNKELPKSFSIQYISEQT
jgi:L-threonylcarbamoyladenylate synthase